MLIVSLTTLPSRLKDIETTLISIEKQTRKPDCILLNLPSNKNYDLQILHQLQKRFSTFLVINNTLLEKDYGPVCKLLGALFYLDYINEKKSQQIITIDDDVDYHPTLIEDLLFYYNQQKQKKQAISFGGASVQRLPPFIKTQRTNVDPKSLSFGESLLHFHKPEGTNGRQGNKGVEVDWLMGTAGVLYDSNMFRKEDIDLLIKWSENEYMFRADDVTISAILSKNHIKRLLVWPTKNNSYTKEEKCLEDSLSKNLIKAYRNHMYSYLHCKYYYDCFLTNTNISGQDEIITTTIYAICIIALIILVLFWLYQQIINRYNR